MDGNSEALQPHNPAILATLAYTAYRAGAVAGL
jgi:hypothetical protein